MTRRSRLLGGVASLLLTCASTAEAETAAAVDGQAAAPAPTEVAPLVVTGERSDLSGVPAERTLDSDAIAAYGLDSVDDLLAQVAAEQGDGDEPPVILVNGKLVEDAGDIGGYPAEAVARLQVLPRGAGARVGASSTARVYNVVLRRSFQSGVLTLADKAATEGGWTSHTAAITYTRIQQPNRINATLRVRQDARLLESERDIVQPAPAQPYDLRGNIVADPRRPGSEIDPALSALAGRVVTVAPVPATAAPGLADFLGADAHDTDEGRFRTLRPKNQAVDFNVSANQQLTEKLTAALSGRGSWTENDSLSGLPRGVLVLPADSLFSPFSRDVGLAAYGRTPASYRSRYMTGTLEGALNAALSPTWQASVTGRYARTEARTRTTRQTFSGGAAPVLSDPLFNPFGADFSAFFPLRRDRALSRISDADLKLALRGAILDLPAGPLRISATGGWTDRRSESENSASFSAGPDRKRRERRAQATADIPIASREKAAFPWLGDLTATAEYAVADLSDVGVLRRSSFGVNWTPRPWAQLQASRTDEDQAPQLGFLSGPVITTTGVRYFDVLTGQTVDITSVSGGNPALGPESLTTERLGLTLKPVKQVNLQLRAEYTAVTSSGAATGLPPTSLAVMAAFPERFVRDASGQLVLVDFRPIALERQRQEQVNWGSTLDLPLGAAPPPPRPGVPYKPPARLQVTASHTYYLTNEVVIRRGLPTLDLLRGEALGFGAGRPRHQVNASVGLSQGGLGAQLTGTWRSGSELKTGPAGAQELRFAPLGLLNLRAYADLKTALPTSAWAKGARATLSVANLANARQRVRDETGATPLRYQPAYQDPIGRTVELELRKTF